MLIDNSLLKILVVDDEHQNLQVVINYFKQQPYNILYAPNGKEAFDVALREIPEAIIMDWAMPIMNGIDAILKLKASNVTKDIPIIMATGVMTTSEDLKEALEAGAVDFIRKPFDPLELTSRVQAALRLSSSYKEIKIQSKEIEILLGKEKELLEKELAHKDRELALQAMNAHEKDHFLSSLKSQLVEIGNQAECLTPINKLLKNIDNQLTAEKSWSNFMMHFEKVHPNFFSKLKSEYMNLTTNELRLSAYLKIGMSNKEIAQVTGVETGTVKSNLNRLKKKINLNPKDSLRDFILYR